MSQACAPVERTAGNREQVSGNGKEVKEIKVIETVPVNLQGK